MSVSGWRVGGWQWLLEGEGGRGAEQFEGAPLSGRWAGELLDPLPAEGDGLAVKGRQVAEQVAVFPEACRCCALRHPCSWPLASARRGDRAFGGPGWVVGGRWPRGGRGEV